VGTGGHRNTHDSDEEIEVDNTYHGEEEGIEGDDDNENDKDDPQKPKEILTPLRKYVTRLRGVLESVAWAGTSTLGVSSSVEGAPMMSRQLSDGGDHLSQHEIKSQPLDVT
jgi:hypothetical protein